MLMMSTAGVGKFCKASRKRCYDLYALQIKGIPCCGIVSCFYNLAFSFGNIICINNYQL